MNYSVRGKVPATSSEESGSQQQTSRVTVTDYFFGPKQTFTSSPASSQGSSRKSTRPAINRPRSNEATSHTSAVHHSNLLEHHSTKRNARSVGVKFRWMKGDLLGKGSHGKVYMGLNVNTGEIMAVKQVELPQTASDRMKGEMKKIAEALREERETLKDLDHEHIVQYLGFEENEESLNIFLQYVSGGSIGTCLSRHGRFNEEVTKHFTSQILDGLVYLHDKGIIHRDLKSDNILVEESGICKLSDFGISKKLVELKTRAYSVQGTSYWMAPEVFRGEGYDSKIDIWSVGCVVLEMWTAKRPWNGYNLLSAWNKLAVDGSAPPLPENFYLSPEAEAFRRRCFKSALTRPTASELLDDPYLRIPEGWTFPGMSNLGVRIAMNSSETNAIVNKLTTSDTEKKITRAMTFLKGSTIMKFSGEEQSSPAERMAPNISTLGPRVSIHADLPRGPSPPLVTIKPPGPRKQKSSLTNDRTEKQYSASTASDSSGSQRSSQSASRPRRLMVYNPDSDEGKPPYKIFTVPQPKPYIYEAPPFLSDDVKRTTSHDRLLAPVRSQLYGPDRILNSAKSIDKTPSSAINEHTSFSGTETSYSSSANSIWQKPPTEFVKSSRNRQFDGMISAETSRSLDINTTHTASGHVQEWPHNIGETRPAIGEVIEHLETFFPLHDLNESVVYSPSERIYPPTQNAMKSLKAIAEESRSTPVTQRTKLWDSQVEEIKTPRWPDAQI